MEQEGSKVGVLEKQQQGNIKQLGFKAKQERPDGKINSASNSSGNSEETVASNNTHLGAAKEFGNESGKKVNKYQRFNFSQAIKYHEQHFSIAKDVGDKSGEGVAYENLGNAYRGLRAFQQTIKYHKQHFSIAKEVGDKSEEGVSYGNLGNAYQDVSDFKQALKYYEQHLSNAKEVGDKAGEAVAYGNLGIAYHGIGSFKQAIKYHEQCLSIAEELGDKAKEGRTYGNLGNVYQGLRDFKQAIKYFEQCLCIAKEVGDKAGETVAYGNLGVAYQNLSDFKQAKKYYEQHLSIAKELGDKAGEGRAYGNLGIAFQELGDFKEAMKYHEQHLRIAKELSEKEGEGAAYGNLGNAFQGLGDFKQAIKCHEQHLSLAKEVGSKAGEGAAYGNLGIAFHELGEVKQAIKYQEQSLRIAKEVGDKAGEGGAYNRLGQCFHSLSNFRKAMEYHKKNFNIVKEVGNRDGYLCAYFRLVDIHLSIGDLARSLEYCLESLRIANAIGHKKGIGIAFCRLGKTYLQGRDFELAKKYFQLHLDVAKELGDKCGEGCAYDHLGWCFELLGCLHEALDFFQCSVNVYNGMRLLLQFEDTWKVSFRDAHQEVYTSLVRVLLKLSKTDQALCAAEKGKAQALMDLMATNYGLELPLNLCLDIASDTSSQICFVALEGKKINLWLLCKGKDSQFQQREVQGRDALSFLMTLTRDALKENKCGRSLENLRGEALQLTKASGKKEYTPGSKNNSLELLYRNIFSPIASFLEGDEIIIVPDGPLGIAPFAAFLDDASRYLSESFRIRMIPSLTSLKLLANCPEDYHSKTGALLVGDPYLGEITNIFGQPKIPQLPYAKKEVEMIGKILNTAPLTGKEATKDEVLKRIGSVGLVHIAAHGKMGSGEIILAPNPEREYSDPEEKDYILKIADVHAVQLRARLVVLSCCHSGEGEIKAEGVIGIARALMGAGARSILVSLWAIDDEATMEFMKIFYQHMRNENSASVSLNQAMKCLRESSKFNEVKFWAPFVLIGDDVRLDFGENEQEHCSVDGMNGGDVRALLRSLNQNEY